MFAIISRADGFPVSRHIADDAPGRVVTWTSEAAASAFLAAKGIQADYQVVALTEESLTRMAGVLGCPPDAIVFDAYPD